MNKEIVAISSLESPDHASKKDPGITSVLWTLGRRCNYDCSYCSPFIHDNFSPHIKLEDAKKFLSNLEKNALNRQKKIKIAITGGEPYVHPQFLDILKHAHSLSTLMLLSVTTNGSLPLETYMESVDYITNLTVSLHLEQNENVIDQTIHKILELNKIENLFFHVNLMALPGKLKKIKDLCNIFRDNNVKFIVRKIDPPEEYEKKNKIQKKHNHADGNFIANKIDHKSKINQNLEINWEKYYSQEELDYFNSFNDVLWQNMRIYMEDGTFYETNADNIKIQSKNNYANWHCYIGIDTIYIQDDGSIFRGYCMAGNKIGHISEDINWPTSPIICPFKYCECVADIVTRKAKEIKHLPLIS